MTVRGLYRSHIFIGSWTTYLLVSWRPFGIQWVRDATVGFQRGFKR